MQVEMKLKNVVYCVYKIIKKHDNNTFPCPSSWFENESDETQLMCCLNVDKVIQHCRTQYAFCDTPNECSKLE